MKLHDEGEGEVRMKRRSRCVACGRRTVTAAVGEMAGGLCASCIGTLLVAFKGRPAVLYEEMTLAVRRALGLLPYRPVQRRLI